MSENPKQMLPKHRISEYLSQSALGRLGAASEDLLHAQAIVLELRTNLDLDVWDGARGLADLYTYLHGELVAANVRKDADRTAQCRRLVESLRDAWRSRDSLSRR